MIQLEEDGKIIEESSKSNRQMFINEIENIHEDDLPLIENNLSFNEKVSLSFLLYGNTKTNTLFILQKLLVLYKNQNLDSDLLLNYKRINTKNWRFALVEGLAIIKAHRVLRKLGINRYEYEVMFLPYNPETSLCIHPVLKVLYYLCENLRLVEAEALKTEIGKTIKMNFSFSDIKFLEIILLEWIDSSVISIGEWPKNNINKKANLNLILNFLKLYEKDSLKEKLISVCNYVNNNINMQSDILKDAIERKYNNTVVDNNFENDCYKIDSLSAGYVLIINQFKFHIESEPSLEHLLPSSPFKDREGTEQDKKILRDTFKNLGFRVHVKDNLKHNEIITTIQNYVTLSATFDSLIICILSHGLEGVIYGSNSIPVKINQIENIFASSKFLIQKPKVLIIQACQGTKLQEISSNLELDCSVDDLTIYADIERKERQTFKNTERKNFSDILTIVSTVKGYASFRDLDYGSWFIQTLCKNINVFYNTKHLLDILTVVIREISERKTKQNFFMVPQLQSTLGKHFWLPKPN